MVDLIWQRSGFVAAVLATVELGLNWLISGTPPPGEKIGLVVTLWLSVFGFQGFRPVIGVRGVPPVVQAQVAQIVTSSRDLGRPPAG